MSGFRLRALLEETDLCETLINNNGNRKPDGKSKLQVPNNFAPSSASLLNTNIWDDNDDDFNLEYMDLDEFLTETGLVDTNFASIMNGTSTSPAPERPASEQSQTQENPISGIDSLLQSVQEVASPSSSDSNCIVSPKDQEQPAPSSPEDCSNDNESITPQKDRPSGKHSVNIVKKRKYKEDGEGLDDTSVVVVPGQDGFDPAQTKFAPEELQPQPIIKKSKKQFVPEENKDEKYWRRRNKNNVAAKRSREARRAKENQIIMRAGFLEDENDQLRRENKDLKKENDDLKNLVRKLKLQAK